jgi:hypothetical protein
MEARTMVVISFPDEKTEQKAIGFLLRRSSGKFFKSGEHIVPESAMLVLAEADIPFIVHRKASDEEVTPIRSALASSLQRRSRRARRAARPSGR